MQQSQQKNVGYLELKHTVAYPLPKYPRECGLPATKTASSTSSGHQPARLQDRFLRLIVPFHSFDVLFNVVDNELPHLFDFLTAWKHYIGCNKQSTHRRQTMWNQQNLHGCGSRSVGSCMSRNSRNIHRRRQQYNIEKEQFVYFHTRLCVFTKKGLWAFIKYSCFATIHCVERRVTEHQHSKIGYLLDHISSRWLPS